LGFTVAFTICIAQLLLVREVEKFARHQLFQHHHQPGFIIPDVRSNFISARASLHIGQVFLKLLDRPRQWRLLDMQSFRCTGEMKLFSYCKETT
jgi:hypothetical protein